MQVLQAYSVTFLIISTHLKFTHIFGVYYWTYIVCCLFCRAFNVLFRSIFFLLIKIKLSRSKLLTTSVVITIIRQIILTASIIFLLVQSLTIASLPGTKIFRLMVPWLHSSQGCSRIRSLRFCSKLESSNSLAKVNFLIGFNFYCRVCFIIIIVVILFYSNKKNKMSFINFWIFNREHNLHPTYPSVVQW